MDQAVAGLNGAFVAGALDMAPPAGAQTVPFTGVTSDSRGDVAGSLFVAIRGERFDGHQFIETAVAAGAAGVIAAHDWARGRALPVSLFTVDDPLAAYRRLAGAWRRRFSLPVVAIAGSAGKTTTKDLLAAMLSGKYRHVLATVGSRNGYLGLAMTLMALRPEHEAAVVEIGIDARGAMAEHAGLVRPDAALVTTIGAEHLAALGDVETVAAEECSLLTWVAGHGGTVFVHDADDWLRPYAAGGGRCVRYALVDRLSEVVPDKLQGVIRDGRLALHGMGLAGDEFVLPLPGRHNALNLLAAATVARSLGLTAGELRAGLDNFQPAFARSNRVELSGGVTVLADYYNASPVSVPAALEALGELGRRRRWVCLGDMLELGPDELDFHRALAAPIVALGVHGVLLYGRRMAALGEALRDAGFGGVVECFDGKTALADFLAARLRPDDAVLIKGSRGMAMEDVMAGIGRVGAIP